jgi:hypothetical protein
VGFGLGAWWIVWVMDRSLPALASVTVMFSDPRTSTVEPEGISSSEPGSDEGGSGWGIGRQSQQSETRSNLMK